MSVPAGVVDLEPSASVAYEVEIGGDAKRASSAGRRVSQLRHG
jgi:hypothetical protein